jgi:hypothetical protein
MPPQDQAKRLPAAVFDCRSPSASSNDLISALSTSVQSVVQQGAALVSSALQATSESAKQAHEAAEAALDVVVMPRDPLGAFKQATAQISDSATAKAAAATATATLREVKAAAQAAAEALPVVGPQLPEKGEKKDKKGDKKDDKKSDKKDDRKSDKKDDRKSDKKAEKEQKKSEKEARKAAEAEAARKGRRDEFIQKVAKAAKRRRA